MKIFKSQYRKGRWSEKLVSDLDSTDTLVLAFFDPTQVWDSVVQEVLEAYPKAQIAGCSSSGEIFGSGVYDESFSLMVIKFDKTKLRLVELNLEEKVDSLSVGRKLGTEVVGADLKYVLLLSDGLNVNGTALAQGVDSITNPKGQNSGVTISGGLSGDGARFSGTWGLTRNGIKTKNVIAVGFYGTSLHVGTGSLGGWDAFGPVRKITLSENNVLHTIDDRPALDLYKEYLGAESQFLPSSALKFPLAISHGDRRDVVRTVLSVSEPDKTMTFAGDLPQGADVQLMKANFARLVEGSHAAAKNALTSLNAKSDKPFAVIAVSCVGRRLVLGERIEDETEAIQNVFGTDQNTIGFYSYGELSPGRQGGCELHNQTMTLTLLQEV